MRLIDAHSLSAFIDNERATLHNEQQTFKAMSENEFNTRDYMLLHFQHIIDKAPTVDKGYNEGHIDGMLKAEKLYARPIGKWIRGEDEETGLEDLYPWTCSECKVKYPWQPNYCPNCGALMKGEEK